MLLWRFFTTDFFQNHPKYEVYLQEKVTGTRGILPEKSNRDQRYTSGKKHPRLDVYLVEKSVETRDIPHGKNYQNTRYTS